MNARWFTVSIFLASVSLLALLAALDGAQSTAAQLEQPGLVAPTVPALSRQAQMSAPTSITLTKAAASTAGTENVELVGQIGGAIQTVFVQGEYAYVGVGLKLTILDISNPDAPTMVGRTHHFTDTVQSIYVSGTHAYVAAGEAGLLVVDVSDPAVPSQVASCCTEMSGHAYGVVVSGTYAYIADGWSSGLWLVNVSNPAAPKAVGHRPTPGDARDVVVAGNYAYIADGWDGLQVVDISTPNLPLEAGFCDTPVYAQSVAISGTHAYVADGWNGLIVVDIFTPTTPVCNVGSYDTPGDAKDVTISGAYAYVADEWRGLRVVDISTPVSPTEVGFYDTPEAAQDVAVAEGYAYVADSRGGLRLVDVSTPTNPAEVGFYKIMGAANGVAVAGDPSTGSGQVYAYVADIFDGLWVVDVSTPTSPTEVGFCNTPGSARNVAVVEDTSTGSGQVYAYITDGSGGLRVIDVSTPTNPICDAGFNDAPQSATDVVVTGTFAYVANGWDGLWVGYIAVPTDPTELATCDIPECANGVAVTGAYAYVAAGQSGLQVVDLRYPTIPAIAGSIDTPGDARDVAVSGNYAYVADDTGGLRIVDISVPTTPKEVGFYDTPVYAKGVAVAQGYAYVADDYGGLRVVDVSVPTTPTEVGFYDTPGYAYGVAVAEGLVYVADSDGGLYILNFTGTEDAPEEVTINGPTTGHVNTPHTFTAIVEPITVTRPITYVWQATGQDPVTRTIDGWSDTVGFSWPTTGTQTITVTASNAEGTVSDTHIITIVTPGACYARLNDDPTDYTSVQTAVDAAQDGDTVKVAGYCAGVESRAGLSQTVYISKNITLRGGYTTTNWGMSNPVSNPTTLDAQGQGRVIYITWYSSPTVEGLRITGGNAKGLGGWIHPMYNRDAGGGIYIDGSSAIISNNQIFSNTADGGGGLFLLGDSNVTLNGNTITANTANSGGGLFLWWFSDATLNGNTVFSNTAVWEGGGLHLSWDSDATLNGNTVTANTANTGGGLFLSNSDATLINNVVADNQVESSGSGLYVQNSSPQLRHNTIARNHGGGGEGLYVTGAESSQPQLHNTILVSHTVGVCAMSGNTVTLEATLWGTDTWANDTAWGCDGTVITRDINVWGDPDFVDYASLDYHINAGSAAVDAGVYSFLDDDVDEDDVDGDPRPMAFGPDIGADERRGPGLQLNRLALLPLSLNAHNPGRIVTYTLVVTGVGTGPVNSVILTDTLPPEQRVVASAASKGDCAPATTPVWGGQVACTLGTLNVGDRARITLTVQVTTTIPSTFPRRMRNSVWVTGDQASNFAYADAYLQDCHVKLNDGPSEWNDIQTAVDTSTQATDVVKVAGLCAGINTRGGTPQVVYINKTVTLRGGYSYSPANWTTPDPAANPTTLHAAGRGRVLYIRGDINPTVEGLHITGGDADGLKGFYYTLWRSDAGGGIYIHGTTAIISNSQVFSNTAEYGGGLYLQWSGATLNGNTVTANIANTGGGLYLEGSGATLNGNTVTANTADYGGGLHLGFSDATLINNVVADNRVNTTGSGLYISGSSPRMLHTTIARNSGGDGSGLYATDGYRWPYMYYSNAALTNTILVSHHVGIIVTAGNTATLTATLWGTDTWANDTNWSGDGIISTGSINIWDYPDFVAPDAGDYHIGPGSAAIDRGITTTVYTDIDGDERPIGKYPDLGADEFTPELIVVAPASVDITGPTTGTVNAPHTFTATVHPLTATTPITYVWQATWQLPVTHTDSLSDTTAFTWGMSGTQTITVTASNAQGWVTATHAITITPPPPPPPMRVTISGPATGNVNTVYTFTATVNPPTTTQPIAYLWQATRQQPNIRMDGLNDSVIFTWPEIGVKTITVTAVNVESLVSDTHVISLTRPPGDHYEVDDACTQARSIPTNETVQVHTFHDQADEDWVAFQASAGITYVVTARVPPTSTADLVLELYDSCEAAGSFKDDDPTFSPEIRLVFTPDVDHVYYLRLLNHDPANYGPNASYHLSIRAPQYTIPSGAIILVAGRLRASDALQGNIHNVTNAVYRLARENGCAPEQIYYLATDLSLDADDDGQPDVNQLVTSDTLQYAITQWARDKVGPDQALTVYMMDHGDYDKFYLDEPNGERVSPEDLNGWLESLETDRPGVPVNVVVDACKSGSFIDPANKVSQGERVVIASTNADTSAYASTDGAAFSDAFLTGLKMGLSLRGAFEEAMWALEQAHPLQTPWLDDTGDGVHNTPQDGEQAVERGLTCVLGPSDKWPPYIARAEMRLLPGGRVEIWVEVWDDKGVKDVWAVIYPPSWEPPEPGDEIVKGPPPITLHSQTGQWYAGTYGEFDEIGTYRIVIYAEDHEGLQARPKEIKAPELIYLPLILKQ